MAESTRRETEKTPPTMAQSLTRKWVTGGLAVETSTCGCGGWIKGRATGVREGLGRGQVGREGWGQQGVHLR